MPLNFFLKDGFQSGWAIWHIEETEAQLTSDIIGLPPPEITNEKKRLEWLAGRHAIMALCNHVGLRYFGVCKDTFGKPFLEKYPHSISLSHSFPYVAAQIDKTRMVGIDIEQPREKLLAIAPRILSSSELLDAGKDITKLCIYWCAKEALFKVHGRGSLFFSQHLNVEPFSLSDKGALTGHIVNGRAIQDVAMSYRVEKEYVLVTGTSEAKNR